MAAPADQALILLEGLYALVESQSVVAAAALLMHGILLLLFVLALFFLLRHHAEGQSIRVLLFTAVLLAGFAIFQVVLDVSLAALPSTVLQIYMKEGMSKRAMSLLETFATMYNVRQGALATNKCVSKSGSIKMYTDMTGSAIADSLLLYRCYLIWTSSHYARRVLAIPLLLILATAAIAYAAIYLVLDIRIPFGFALLTNFVLLGLTGGRIWYKRRQAAVLLGATVVHRRYTAALEIIFESGLIYVAAVLIYLVSISKSVPPFTTFQNICWGSLAQLVNIVPMMIVVRVALAKTASAPDSAASSMHKEFV